MSKDPSLKSQASAIFIGNLAGTVFQFLIPAIIVRLISKEDFGVFRQFSLLAGTFESLLAFGFVSSLYYFYPISDKTGKEKVIQQTQLFFFISLLIFTIIFYLFGNKILIKLNFPEFMDVKFLIIIYLVFTMLSSIVSNIFTLEKNTFLNKIYPPIEKVVRFFIFLITILLIPGFLGPILALVFFGAARFLFVTKHIFPYIKNWHALDMELLKKQFMYSLPFGLALVLNLVSTTFDKYFINQYITPSEFGVYSIAFLSIPILSQFFASVHNVVVPQISVFMNENKKNEATRLWQKTVDKTSSITIPAVILFWILAKEIITVLYTKEYIEAANYYRIFVPMFFVSMFSHEIILRASNRTRYIFISNVIGTIITVITGIVLIPKFGLYGAIITALVGTITPMIISLNIERKIMNLRLYNFVNWHKIGLNFLICLSIGFPLLFLKDYISNIYLRSALVVIFFCSLVLILQLRFDIFIFKDFIYNFFKKIKK